LDFSKNTKETTVEKSLTSIPPVSLMLPNGTEFPHKGRIETTSGSINTETGSISVRATFPNPGNIIRSGSSGVVRIPRNVENAVIIPQKATYEIQGKKFIYVVDNTGTVKSTEVKVLDTNNGQYFVVEQGLNPGDKIVLEGAASLREGASINPKEVNKDSVYQAIMK
jgi:membrane fusion protein, multidrug efflux system